MCGRASLAKLPKDLEIRYKTKFIKSSEVAENRLPNFNIAPTHWHPVVTNEAGHPLKFFKWGLIPHWAKDHKIGSRLINARSETILEKPAFQNIHKKRCIVPFDGFYEWKREGNKKVPYRIVLKDTEIFSLAGIWAIWKNPDGNIIPTFSLLTQEPNNLMAAIHNRMPAILSPEQEKDWLDMDVPTKEVLKLIEPYPEEKMEAYRVSMEVNRVSENRPDLLERVAE